MKKFDVIIVGAGTSGMMYDCGFRKLVLSI